MTGRLVPKLVTTLQGYSRAQFSADLLAGIIVGVVALPLAIAFAIASGVKPEQGLYTAIIAGFLISALGGSRVQIGGPTGAFVVIVSGIVAAHGVEGLAVATLLAGMILVAMGLARLGGVITFIPYPVTLGFTSGIAIIIFTGQVKDLLGLRMGPVPPDLPGRLRAFAAHAGDASPAAMALSAGTILLLVLWPRISRRVPAPFVALVLATVAVAVLGLPVETVGSRYGAIPRGLPVPALPEVSPATVAALAKPAFTIAMLGAIESLLSAVVADGMIGTRHRSNMELVAQGVANMASPLFGGIPATGAIARTATNVRNGGRTPVAGIVHALTLLVILLLAAPLAERIPLAALAGILTVVSYHMSEWRTFVGEVRRAPRRDVAVMVITFLLTILVDLTVAVEVGMVLAAFLFMQRMAEVSNVAVFSRAMQDAADDGVDPDAAVRREIPPGVDVYEINGPFFFGAAESFKEAAARVSARPRVLVIRLRNVPLVDQTGIHALRQVLRRCEDEGTRVLLCDVQEQPRVALERAGVLAALGPDGVAGTLEEALARAAVLAGPVTAR